MRKLFLFVLSIVPLGMFAQEIRYVTVPASQEATPAPVASAPVYQAQSQKTESVVNSNGLFRDELKTSEGKAIHTTFVKNIPQDNWFISFSAGAAMLQSEESRYRDLKDQFSFTGGLALGKWWSPVWGLRVSATAAKLQGFAINGLANKDDGTPNGYYFQGSWLTGKPYTNGRIIGTDADGKPIRQSGVQNSYTDGTTPEGASLIADRFLNTDKAPIKVAEGWGYTYDLTYAAASVDLMLNLRNYFSRYDPKAGFNPVLYAGLGYAHTFGDDKKDWLGVNSIMGKTGMQLNFRLGDAVDFFLDGQLLILPEFFDRRVGDDKLQDLVLNAQIGFTYKFNERFFYEPLCKTVYVNSPVIASNPGCCDDLLARLKRIEEILDRQPAPGAGNLRNANAELEHLKVIVHFIIDKWEVRQSEMYKLDEIAKFMAKYPRVRVSISGYADVQTAYPEYNMKLSLKRANEVARILGSKYGIDKSRLRIEHYGDTVQPFEINELNRAVIAFDIPEY